MIKKTDVLVIGSGMAGMCAALAAAQAGKKTTLLFKGAGSTSISSGLIDILGYWNNARVTSPFEIIKKLPQNHPYSLIGESIIRDSLKWLSTIFKHKGFPLSHHSQEDNNGEIMTVLGTIKPSFLFPDSFNTEAMSSVQRIAVLSVEGMKDIHPNLIIKQAIKYKQFSHKQFFAGMLPSPMPIKHRNIIPLDIARFVEKEEGYKWLKESLNPFAELYPLLLIPPICGVENRTQIWNRLSLELGVKIVEMISLPPGVAGFAENSILRRELSDQGVSFLENTEAISSTVSNGLCDNIITYSTQGEQSILANKYIIATGGILGGGILTEPGKATERLFNLPIDVPENTEDWSSPEIFGNHLLGKIGVRVNKKLQPTDSDGNVLLSNVYFAGRILGGYDNATEKSGQGIAISTGYYAGMLAGRE